MDKENIRHKKVNEVVECTIMFKIAYDQLV